MTPHVTSNKRVYFVFDVNIGMLKYLNWLFWYKSTFVIWSVQNLNYKISDNIRCYWFQDFPRNMYIYSFQLDKFKLICDKDVLKFNYWNQPWLTVISHFHFDCIRNSHSCEFLFQRKATDTSLILMNIPQGYGFILWLMLRITSKQPTERIEPN